jgi:hypothetical protein
MSDPVKPSDVQLGRIWELFAELDTPPAEAVAALLRHNNIEVSEEEAAEQIAAAKSRNAMQFLTRRPDRGTHSGWLQRIRR